MSRCVWDLPGSGIDPVSPALAGGFFTTEPPHQGSSCMVNTVQISFICSLTITMSFFSFIENENEAQKKKKKETFTKSHKVYVSGYLELYPILLDPETTFFSPDMIYSCVPSHLSWVRFSSVAQSCPTL